MWLACCLYWTKSSWRCVGRFLRRWRKIWIILQPIGSTCRYLKKCPKPWTQTWTRPTLLTLLSQRKLTLTARNTLFASKNYWSLQIIKKLASFRTRVDQWPCMSSKAKSISWDSPFKNLLFKILTCYSLKSRKFMEHYIFLFSRKEEKVLYDRLSL